MPLAQGLVHSGPTPARYRVIASYQGTNPPLSVCMQIIQHHSIATLKSSARACVDDRTQHTSPVDVGAAVPKYPSLTTSMPQSDTCDSAGLLQTLPTPPPSSPPCPTESYQKKPLEPAVGDNVPPSPKCLLPSSRQLQVLTQFVPQTPSPFCPPPCIQICDLTPPRLLELAPFYGQDYVIPHVSRIQFEAWLTLYPELEDDTNHENHEGRYIHAEVPIGE